MYVSIDSVKMATQHRGLTSMAHRMAASAATGRSEMRARSMFSSTYRSPHVHTNMFPKTCFRKHVPKEMFSDTCPQFHILCTYIHPKTCVSRTHVITEFLHSIFAILLGPLKQKNIRHGAPVCLRTIHLWACADHAHGCHHCHRLIIIIAPSLYTAIWQHHVAISETRTLSRDRTSRHLSILACGEQPMN